MCDGQDFLPFISFGSLNNKFKPVKCNSGQNMALILVSVAPECNLLPDRLSSFLDELAHKQTNQYT